MSYCVDYCLYVKFIVSVIQLSHSLSGELVSLQTMTSHATASNMPLTCLTICVNTSDLASPRQREAESLQPRPRSDSRSSYSSEYQVIPWRIIKSATCQSSTGGSLIKMPVARVTNCCLVIKIYLFILGCLK